jgi:hypothetical protein
MQGISLKIFSRSIKKLTQGMIFVISSLNLSIFLLLMGILWSNEQSLGKRNQPDEYINILTFSSAIWPCHLSRG